MNNRSTADYIFLVLFSFLLLAFIIGPDYITGNLLTDVMDVIGTVPLFIGVILLIWSLVQVNVNLNVFPSPNQDTKLQTTGIYKFLRHPMYAGIIFIAIGMAIRMDVDGVRLTLALLSVIFFTFLASYEEKKLMEKFPEYADYQQNVMGRFIPTFMRFKIKVEKDEAKPAEASAQIPEEVQTIEIDSEDAGE